MTKQQRIVLLVAIMASFVGAVDGFIVNVALPAIGREFGGGLAVQQWVVDAYLITLGSLILIAGSLSDLFGRKQILSIGLWWFGIASLLCAIAPTGTLLIIARGLQGAAGALLVPSSLAMIISAFNGPSQGKAIGVWTAWFSIAAVTGPLLGGLILSFTSWRWIFGVNVVPIAVTLWLMRSLDQLSPAKPTKVDVTGALLCAAGLGGTVFALIEKPLYAWTNPIIYLPLAIGLLALACFVRLEARISWGMLPLSLFKIRNFSAGNIATLAIYGGLSLATFAIVLTLQQVIGYSALQAGLALLPVTIIMFLLSSRFGALSGRFGPRVFMGAGPVIAAGGFLLMTQMNREFDYLNQLLPGVLVFGLGLSITVAPLTSAVLSEIPPRNAGVASAVNNAVARIAGLLTVAAVGLITGPQLSVSGFRRVMVGTAVLLVMGGLISAIGIQNSKNVLKRQ